jgi:hypothetical protein
MKAILLIILLLPLPAYLLAEGENPTPGTYDEGLRDGMDAQKLKDEKMIAAMGRSCTDPQTFNLIITTPENFNTDTCQDVIGNIEKALQDDTVATHPENQPHDDYGVPPESPPPPSDSGY